jgi:hypothetical protein
LRFDGGDQVFQASFQYGGIPDRIRELRQDMLFD